MGFGIVGHPHYDIISEEHINLNLGMFFRSWINSLNYENYINSVFNIDLKIYAESDKKTYQLDENEIITSKRKVNNHIIWELQTLKGLSIWIESIFDFYNLDISEIESYKNEVERNDINYNESKFINFITDFKNNNTIGVMKKTSKLIEFLNNNTTQQKKYILILMYLDYSKTEDFLKNKYDNSITQNGILQQNIQPENSLMFFNKVNQSLVGELDVFNFIERSTNNEIYKLQIMLKDIEAFEIDYISKEVVESILGSGVHNVKNVSEPFKKFKELVLKKIEKEPQKSNNLVSVRESIFNETTSNEKFINYLKLHIVEPYVDYSYLFQRMLKENLIIKTKHLDFANWLLENNHITENTKDLIIKNNGFRSLKKSFSAQRENNFNNVFNL